MNYEGILEESRRLAERDAANMYPPSPQRNEFRRWLVVKLYLERISPIVVDEALSPP